MFWAAFNFLGRKRGQKWNEVNENWNEIHWKKENSKMANIERSGNILETGNEL
jgi:hypothetical protein